MQCFQTWFVSFVPKFDWHLPNSGRMCWMPGKIVKTNALALSLSLHLHPLTSTIDVKGCKCKDITRKKSARPARYYKEEISTTSKIKSITLDTLIKNSSLRQQGFRRNSTWLTNWSNRSRLASSRSLEEETSKKNWVSEIGRLDRTLSARGSFEGSVSRRRSDISKKNCAEESAWANLHKVTQGGRLQK